MPAHPCNDDTRLRVGDPLPAVLLLPDLIAILNLSASHLQRLERDGWLKPFELLPHIGHQQRYSGRKIQDWLDGKVIVADVPDDDTSNAPSSRYFQKGRR